MKTMIVWLLVVPRTLGLGCMLVIAFAITGLVAAWAMLARRLKWVRAGNMLTTHGWGWLGAFLCYPWRLRTIRIDGVRIVRRQLDPNRPVVVVGNHPRTLDLFGFVVAISSALTGRTLHPVIKLGHNRNAFGKGVEAAGGLGIDRSGGQDTVDRIHQWAVALPKRFGALCAPVIYPDGSRGTSSKRERACNRKLEKYRDDAEMSELVRSISAVTMLPHPGGLAALLKGLGNAQVVLVCTANTSDVDRMGEICVRPAGAVHVRMRIVTDELAGDDRGLERRLYRVWAACVVPYLQSEKGKE
ncbi:MAG: hypothetical protein COU35_03350 [Candidatus Magasanikbacteria bacterium CG10_big_fil_rev_8_21_14_0_10_47_10]|uniref:Phospholipid/glycerol acyltransferase domain-containing protein n=1 Tax=Candidatus Magasanikbacteria bacterium CG10_big_fil_rev_8_21_14_0_10_47_10 TaxID=1974652 RepID=A0A2H0TQ58_9BACT|nr:MAG: hypothetical protein COU35_03350 [Candidatus Magasanikbacteria bacterium CG10_big_fil_rev_8_21_14_0_10_47_10]